jgi:hypothetical protein
MQRRPIDSPHGLFQAPLTVALLDAGLGDLLVRGRTNGFHRGGVLLRSWDAANPGGDADVYRQDIVRQRWPPWQQDGSILHMEARITPAGGPPPEWGTATFKSTPVASA